MNKNFYSLIFLSMVLALVLNCGKKAEVEEAKTTTETAPTETLDPEVAKGKVAFSVNCAACHGETKGW